MTDNEIKPAKPISGEIATYKNDIYYQSFDGVLQPDDPTLRTRAGAKKWKLYDELEIDCHVYCELQKRIKSLTAHEWRIFPASEDDGDIEIANEITEILKNFSFDGLCEDLLDSIMKGFAVSEITWNEKDGKIVPLRTKAVEQRRFVFDDERNLRLLTMSDMFKGQILPERKFIVHQFGMKNDNPYGLGLGSRLFWPVFFKRKGVSSWNIFCERFGMPVMVGKYPPGSGQSEINRLLQAAQAIREQTAIAIPDNMPLEMLEAQRAGSINSYESLVFWCNAEISKVLLGFVNASESPRGALAGEKNRDEVRNELIKDDADKLSETLNSTLIQWLIDFNFPSARTPKLYRIFEKYEDLRFTAYRDGALARLGLPIPQSYFYEKYNIPIPEGDEAVIKLEPTAEQTGGGMPAFAEVAENEIDEIDKIDKDKIILEDAATNLADRSGKLLERRIRQIIALAEKTKNPEIFKKELRSLYKNDKSVIDGFADSIGKANFVTQIMARTTAQK